ncbi:Nucleoid-associated protein [Caloramator mitchellensis]|uniref:Nucleoid-associated protein ABG79_01950 n=1 Tax=Caloramator mitchellensis TaxID=908809 RepID=A0A0R3JZ29_CALMK|nr:YbaB/EbfC family nucleoid-associated protein [Caloramator mitchellensis]KRQ86220.1 Nucleoid-associated protein [Caloramator mitchellensis]
MFKGGMPPMGGGFNNLLKQVQKVQKQIEEVKEELDNREFEASAGGGAIVAKVNGKKQLLDIQIKPEVVDADDVEMLQDLIIAAVNEAINKAEETVTSEMAKITGGLQMPGLF